MQVIIIDSISHEWEFLLEAHASLTGNSFTNWQKIGLRHKQFIQAILGSKTHVIVTTRTKQDYVLNERNGKMVPEKVGLKTVQREGLDYEFTLVFDLNMKNHAVAAKDRTGLFFAQPEQMLTIETGRSIDNWCNAGINIMSKDITSTIYSCNTIDELLELYNQNTQFKEVLKPDFEKRKREILMQNQTI